MEYTTVGISENVPILFPIVLCQHCWQNQDHQPLVEITRGYWISLDTTGDHWRLLEITGDYWILLEITGNYWRILLGSIGINEDDQRLLEITGDIPDIMPACAAVMGTDCCD